MSHANETLSRCRFPAKTFLEGFQRSVDIIRFRAPTWVPSGLAPDPERRHRSALVRSELVPKNWTDGLALDLISKPREKIRRR
jgi:hypothetical protein